MIHTEKRSSPGDQTDSNCDEAQIPIIYKTTTIIFGTFLGILILVVVIYMLYCLTSKPLKDQSTSVTTTYVLKSDDGTTENSRVLLCNTSPKNKSQLMDNHPIQVSDTTENKPSTTRPFFNLAEGGL